MEIVDDHGRPVPAASVTWWLTDPSKPVRHPLGAAERWEGRADEKGRLWAKELAETEGYVEVTAPQRLGGACAGFVRRRWTWKPGRQSVRVVLALRPDRRTDVRGRVTDRSGGPLAGARVTLLSVRWTSRKGEACTAWPNVEGMSGPGGTFVLDSVPAGKVALLFARQGYAEREIEGEAPGSDIDVILTPGSEWRGRVLRPDGSVLDHCEIGLSMQHPPMSRRSACSASGFILDRIPEGRAQLSVSTRADGDAQLGARIWVQEVEIKANETRSDLHWPSGAEIAGRTVTTSGAPAPAVTVSAFPVAGKPLGDGSGYGVVTRSGADGRFVFRYLTFTGPWSLEGRASGHRQILRDIKPGTSDVVLTVPSPGH